MLYKISAARADYLAKKFFEYSFEKKDLDIDELNSITEPIELHYIVKHYNCDDGNELLLQIAKNPNCDIATAKMIFFRLDIAGYLELGDQSQDYSLISVILTNFEDGFYKKESIYYDFRHDPEALSFDLAEIKATIKADSPLFDRPKGGKTENSFLDHFHHRNLKFYAGSLKSNHTKDKLSVVTDHFKIVFSIPNGFLKIKAKYFQPIVDSWTFPEILKQKFCVTERSLKKVLVEPTLILEKNNLHIIFYIFNAKPFKLTNALTNVATMMNNEIIYLQAFVDIIAVEEGFDKSRRIKYEDAWFSLSKGMQIKISDKGDKYLKVILMERDELIFALYVVADNIVDLNEEAMISIIKQFSIT